MDDKTRSPKTTLSSGAHDDGPASDPLTFGRYENLEFLGQGGMAKVYKAFDPVLGRVVALKFIRGDEPQLAERLLLEARAQARLEHEHLCRIYEAGVIDGKPYIAMQFIKGRTLSELMSELLLPQKVKILIDVALAIHTAHRAGLIHRDLKPANVMVERTEDGDWSPFVMDFGLAREVEAPGMTATGMIVGSPSYMSPEQARGEIHTLDRRSDVFSLGVTMYEMLCGAVPFHGAGSLEVLIQVERVDPMPPRKHNAAIPADLETIVMKCLEKDPSRRYDSAKALAEDLQRFQDGESILARPVGLSERLVKRAARNKAAVTVAVIALLAFLILGGVAVRSRTKAREEAELAGRFGEEVERMEATMLQAYLRPLHDTTSDRKTVLARMAWIEDRMRETGTAQGAGEYALGRGYMVLRDYDNAKKHLDLAWKTHGFQTPKVAQALGLTMAKLFQKERTEADRIPDKSQREKRMAKIDQDLKTPALEYMARGKSEATNGPEYGEALIAYLEKRYEEALKKIETVLIRLPSFYETRVLAGDIYVTLGNTKRDQGDVTAARNYYSRAEATYREAAKDGESDPLPYEALCSLRWDFMTLQIYQTGASLTQSNQANLESCEQALKSNPESVRALTTTSMIAFRQGEYEMAHGRNPGAFIQKAIDAAQMALKVDPDSAIGLSALSRPYVLKGNYERNVGLDSRDSFQHVIEYTQRAIRIDPTDARVYNLLGLAYCSIAGHEKNVGLDPRPMLDRSIENLTRSAEINTNFAVSISNLSIPFLYRSEYETGHGIDPAGSIRKAIEFSRKAINVNPNYSYAYNQLGLGYLFNAETRIQTGSDPQEDFNAAMQAFQKLLEINPEFPQAYGNIGYGYVVYMRHQLNHGQDVSASYGKAVKNLETCLKASLTPVLNLNFLGIARLEKAEYETMRGLDPQRSLLEAMDSFRKSCETGHGAADEFGGICSAYLAQVYLKQGAFLTQKQISPEESLQRAEELLDQANQVNPDFFFIRRLQGEAKLLRGQWEMQNRRSPETWFAGASEAFEQATTINPRDTETRVRFADLHLRLAEWKSRHSLPAQQYIEQGLSQTDKALGVNPQLAQAFRVRGKLCLLSARLTQDAAQQKDWKQRSADSFRQAALINPLLGRSVNQ